MYTGLLSIPEHVIKKGRPRGHRYGKAAEYKEYHLASKEDLQGSMIVSCEIMFLVNECSNMIDTKKFVSNGTILQNKISPIECRNQNIFITDKIGGTL